MSAEGTVDSLESLRREVAALVARRDELEHELAVRRGDAPAPKEPAPAPPSPEHWEVRSTASSIVIIVVLVAISYAAGDNVVWGFTALVGALVLTTLVAPPAIWIDQEGVTIRGFVVKNRYLWKEVKELRVSSRSARVELELVEFGSHSHHFGVASEDVCREVDAAAQTWIAISKQGASKKRKKRKKRRKRKRRRGTGDGLSR